ncbi:MAG TPA: tRNA (guanine(10)-N(2))-dimethyltransferase [Candidatus Nanoarchaeia archaeon]|nr:tRNA (guanine(10)-N(2))-dimethyltransferase [Candidatus Nanoarchaeia archaeon]
MALEMDVKFKPDFPSITVSEGKVQIVAPDLKAYGVCPSDYAPSKAPVFFNPVMEFNRDLTVLAFQAYQKMVDREIVICEPLTATGIRGLRFAAEINGVKNVVSGDINMRSAKLAAYNVTLNNLQSRVSVKHKDANRLLSEHSSPKKRFDIVDIDPFGTPVPHLDAAVQAIRNNGLLAATATDMAPLCGVHSKACIRKYGGKPLRTEYCHELAIRFLAGAIAQAAAKHEIGVHILFSHCSDHYIRVYAQIGYGCQRSDEALRNVGFILHCFACLHREVATKPFPDAAAKCPECGTKMDYAGPLWTGSLFDAQFVDSMIADNASRAFHTRGKIAKLLALTREEVNSPTTYYVLDKLSGKYKLPAPAVAPFLKALREAGFKGIPTHLNTRGIRTDAPASVMHEILKSLVQSGSGK